MTDHGIKIDPEFKALIPPLKQEEYDQLEQNLLKDGCRDPLVVWMLPEFVTEDGDVVRFENVEVLEHSDGEKCRVWWYGNDDEYYTGDWPCILIDGHNRYEICTRQGIDFDVVEMEFPNRVEAKIWILHNQLGRRNLTDYVRVELALLLKPLIAEMAKANQANSTGGATPQLRHNCDEAAPIRTDEAVAAVAGVSRGTVRRVEAIQASAPQEVQDAARTGAMSINLASQVAALPEEEKAEVAAAPIESIKEVAQEVVKRAHVANNSGNNEWYTPAKYIELARSVMGSIDTDPASSEVANQTVKAEVFYTADDDGRGKTWEGNVWMNPPYAQPLMSDFAEAVTSKFQSGEIRQACILVNNATETQWFQRMMEAARAVCFTKGRIKFVDVDGNPGGAPLQGQAIIYMGHFTREFADAFRAEGTVLENV